VSDDEECRLEELILHAIGDLDEAYDDVHNKHRRLMVLRNVLADSMRRAVMEIEKMKGGDP